jgi:hypothetical protein
VIFPLQVEDDAVAAVDVGQPAGFARPDPHLAEPLEDVGQGPRFVAPSFIFGPSSGSNVKRVRFGSSGTAL